MDLVVDANIVIALLLRHGKTHDVFFKDNLRLFAPKLFIDELESYMSMLLERSLFESSELFFLLSVIKKRITIVSEKRFAKYTLEVTYPDPDDLLYIALATYLKCPLWSNDKALKGQSFVKVYATHELLKLLP